MPQSIGDDEQRRIAVPQPAEAPRGVRPRLLAGAVWIRILVSPLLLGTVLGILWLSAAYDTLLPFDIGLLIVGGAAAAEMTLLFRRAGRAVEVAVPVVGSALLAGVGLVTAGDVAPGGEGVRFLVRTSILVLAFLALLFRHLQDTRTESIEGIAFSLVPLLFVGLLFSWMREIGVGEDANHAARMLIWIVLVAKASDIGGYLVGKPFGRHKMIPRVSPGKSWEGLAGGLLLSVLVAVFVPAWLGLDDVAGWGGLPLALFGLAVGGASVLAGILWSGWKRRLGAKDSSALIPEIGGLVDMIDSMLLAAPVAWVWLRFLA